MDRAKRCLSEHPARAAYSARAEDKVKLSDYVIEDEFISTPEFCILYLGIMRLGAAKTGRKPTKPPDAENFLRNARHAINATLSPLPPMWPMHIT